MGGGGSPLRLTVLVPQLSAIYINFLLKLIQRATYIFCIVKMSTVGKYVYYAGKIEVFFCRFMYQRPSVMMLI